MDGLSYSGILAAETGSSITLLGQEAKQQVILRKDLEMMRERKVAHARRPGKRPLARRPRRRDRIPDRSRSAGTKCTLAAIARESRHVTQVNFVPAEPACREFSANAITSASEA